MQPLNESQRQGKRTSAFGIEYLSSHKIRPWAIKEALAAGMDQASVMRVAGHVSPQTMRSYMRVVRLQKDYTESFEGINTLHSHSYTSGDGA